MSRLSDFAPWIIAELTDAYEQAALAAMAAARKPADSKRDRPRRDRPRAEESEHG